MQRTPFGPPLDDAERDALAALYPAAFNIPSKDVAPWLERAGAENLRVLRDAGQVVSGAFRIPMGQYFGGRSIGMDGIAAVATAPEARGTGAGTRLMKALVQEMYRDGVPLAVLYPATQPVYRAAGWEQAGARMEIRLPTGAIAVKERDASLRAATDDDADAIRQIQARQARRRDGFADRGAYLWDRVHQFRGQPTAGYVVLEDGAITGYLFLLQRSATGDRYDLHLTDVVATTPVAARRLLTFLANHRSLANDAVWYGGLDEPLLQHLPEQVARVRLWCAWMLRIVNVVAALEQRGYPAGTRGVLHFQIGDKLVSDNDGAFVLEVEGGQGRVTRGGDGRLQMGVRSLGPLYAGYRSPWQMRQLGMLAGDDDQLAMAAAVFGGVAPSMNDGF